MGVTIQTDGENGWGVFLGTTPVVNAIVGMRMGNGAAKTGAALASPCVGRCSSRDSFCIPLRENRRTAVW